MAFQIRDDLLDFTKPKEAIGKPAGADLRNGNITRRCYTPSTIQPLHLESGALAPLCGG